MASKTRTPQSIHRLLNIFPVAAMRDQWKTGGRSKADVIATIVAKTDRGNIADFVEKSMGLTKQHIYLFSHDIKQLSDLPNNVLGEYGIDKVRKTGSVTEFFYLIPLEYEYVAGSPPVEGTIEFPWPVRFVFRKNLVEVHMTTMEKDLEAYLGDLLPVHSVHRDIEESTILQDFKYTLRKHVFSPLDINCGVKYLWEQDIIDAPRAAWKSPVSTKINAMDGQYMVKRDDPGEYAMAIASPLLKTIFKVLAPNLNWPEVLAIDPTDGQVSIPRYSNDARSIENVLGEILKHN